MHRSLRTLSSWSFSLWEFRATQLGRNEGSWRRLQCTSFGTLNGNGGNSLLGLIQDQIVDALWLGERSSASSMLFDLSQRHYSLRADDFVQILEYCARAPDLLFVMETLRIMEDKQPAVSNKCRFLIIRALSKGGYLDELRALGTEGMIRELIYYLHAAEKQFSRSNSFVGTSLYNTVLHSLVEAKESSMAIDIFKNLLSCGYRPDAVTCNVMID